MALTITQREHHSLGSLTGVSAVVTFDTSYATSGEAITPNDLGLGQLLMLNIIQGEDGLLFEWDKANNKILAYRSGGFTPGGTNSAPAYTGTAEVPFFVEEESLTVSADVGTLAFAPAYIVAIADSTGVSYEITPSDEIPVDNVSVAVNFTTGVLTFAAADDPAAVRVTYFPSRGGTFFDNANAL